MRRSSLWVALVVSGLVAVAGLSLDRYAAETRMRDAKGELVLLMTLRRSTLRQYWDTVRAEVLFWSMAPVVHDSLAELRDGWQALGGIAAEELDRLYIAENPYPLGRRRELVSAGDGSAYSRAHARLHGVARYFVEDRGYYDFFLLGPEGDVLYTVEKEADFATNLLDGPWRKTGLADAFRRARHQDTEGGVVFTDLARYPPSADEPAVFAATAIRDSSGALQGVLAVQLPIERIREIMQFTAGMGESGETYLVGEDLLMRSDSRFSETSTILRTTVDTHTVHRALAGETGVDVTDDYRGIPVLSAFAPIDQEGRRWAVMAEIDHDEVLAPVRDDRELLVLGGLFVVALCVVSCRAVFDG